MKSRVDASTKRILFKLIFCLVTIIQAGALLFAALGWQGAISFQAPLMFVLAALGALCLLCVIAFGYEAFKPDHPGQTASRQQPQTRQAHGDMPNSGQEFRRLPMRYQPSGTALLFDDNNAKEQDELTVIIESRKGLRLTWEMDGNPHNVERFVYPVIIGRDVSCPVVINSPSVSRWHAHLAYEDNEFLISDMGSSNGTFLNGKRVEGATRIAHGDEITLGRVNIRVSYILQ